MKTWSAFLAGLILLPQIAFAISGSVVKIEFSPSESDGGAPVSVSAKVHIDLCSASACNEKAGETAHLLLESSSATGEFSSSVDNWQAVTRLTINSNWSGRNFYYRDSTAGTVTITAKIEEKTDLVATHNLVIGGESPGGTSSSTDPGGGSGGSGSGGSGSSGSGGSSSAGGVESAHTSQEDLSNYEQTTFAIGIGRKRLTSAGASLEFHIDHKKTETGVSYNWSFGDGGSASGEKVTHSYAFPGEYVVIAGGDKNGEQAVARTKVTVIEPKIIIGEFNQAAGFIRLDNSSSREINVGGWQLISGSSTFIFPRDTIIEKGGQLPFPINQLKSIGPVWQLVRPDGVLVSQWGGEGIVLGTSTDRIILSRGQKLILKRLLRAETNSVEVQSPPQSDSQIILPPIEHKLVTTTSQIIELPRQRSAFSRFFGIMGL